MIRTHHLITERLEMRMFRESDALQAYRNWMSDPEVAHFTSWEAHRSPEESLRVIRSWVAEYPLGSIDWCITLRGSDEPIGGITVVQHHPEKGYCEIGYVLSQRYWDRGYMTEALRAAVNFIFDHTDYEWIQARHDTENEASGRCLEKCNFRVLGMRDLPDPKTGKVRTYRFMGIARRDVFVMP